jgi:hypothetical protein
MAPERPDLGPAAHDAHYWETCSSELRIYCLARTFVSAIQLEQELRIFESDPAVKLVWVLCSGSRFEHGLSEWFVSKKISVISYEQAVRGRCDLVVTTSEWIDVTPFAPRHVIVIPHGAGFHKYVQDTDADRLRLSGLARPEGLWTGQVTQVVTHPNQERQLAEACEHTVGRTALGGDSTFDLLLHSRGERAAYRKALGVSDDQRLITLGSTWGRESLFSLQFDLIGQLLAQLPFEQYRLALFLHPAVWSFEGECEILRRLSRHIDAGLMVIPPAEGWHGTLLASDLLIGDNSSTSLYGAMLDIPLLLAAFSENVVPGTVMARLGRTARFINPGMDLRSQIENEITHHDHTRAAKLVEQMIARPGESGELLRELCYTKAGLPVPEDELPVHAAPMPTPKPQGAHSFRFSYDVDADSVVAVDTYPAFFRKKLHRQGERLLVQLGEPDLKLHNLASIVLDPEPMATCLARTRLTGMIDKFIGCCLAVVTCDDGSCEILVRDGTQFHVTCGGALPVRVLACACYAVLVTQKELHGEVLVRTSTCEAAMTAVQI